MIDLLSVEVRKQNLPMPVEVSMCLNFSDAQRDFADRPLFALLYNASLSYGPRT